MLIKGDTGWSGRREEAYGNTLYFLLYFSQNVKLFLKVKFLNLKRCMRRTTGNNYVMANQFTEIPNTINI